MRDENAILRAHAPPRFPMDRPDQAAEEGRGGMSIAARPVPTIARPLALAEMPWWLAAFVDAHGRLESAT